MCVREGVCVRGCLSACVREIINVCVKEGVCVRGCLSACVREKVFEWVCACVREGV